MVEKYIHKFETNEFICTFRELLWKEGLMIDALSFKEDDEYSPFQIDL